MSDTAEAIVLTVFVLATSIWTGGYVAIVVVARTASVTLASDVRVAFFRSLGRSYLPVGLPALIVALISGGVLARNMAWDGLFIATAVVTGVLLLSFVVAVVQARRMTRLRRRLMASPEDKQLSEQVRRGAAAAGGLRGLLGLLTVALVALGAFLAT